MDATHEGGAFIQETEGAFGLERDQGAHRCARRGSGEVGLLDMELFHVLDGQVDAPLPQILADVLKVFDDLQAGAHGVRAADALGGRGAGDREDEAADRIGGELAVGQQVVAGLVARDQLVLAVGLDEAEEGLRGEATAVHGGLQGAQEGVTGVDSNTR